MPSRPSLTVTTTDQWSRNSSSNWDRRRRTSVDGKGRGLGGGCVTMYDEAPDARRLPWR